MSQAGRLKTDVGTSDHIDDIPAAALDYESELDRWWGSLESLAGTKDPESICRSIDEAKEEDSARRAESDRDYDPDSDTAGDLLDEDRQRKVDLACILANGADSDHARALRLWTDAMRLLPTDLFFVARNSASYILMGAGDTLHQCGMLDLALSTMRLAMYVPGTVGTAFAHFLIGRVKLELGDETGARTELGRAMFIEDCDYDGEYGGSLFKGEDVGTEGWDVLLDLGRAGAAEMQAEFESFEKSDSV